MHMARTIDRRIDDPYFLCERPARAVDLRGRMVLVEPRRSRAWHALPLIAAALTTLAGSAAAQGSTASDGTPTTGKVVVEHSAGDIDLPAARFVRAAGVVTDTLDGSSLAGARIEVVGTRVSGRSREDGQFQLAPVPAGRYTVRVTRIGYQPITFENVQTKKKTILTFDNRQLGVKLAPQTFDSARLED